MDTSRNSAVIAIGSGILHSNCRRAILGAIPAGRIGHICNCVFVGGTSSSCCGICLSDLGLVGCGCNHLASVTGSSSTMGVSATRWGILYTKSLPVVSVKSDSANYAVSD